MVGNWPSGIAGVGVMARSGAEVVTGVVTGVVTIEEAARLRAASNAVLGAGQTRWKWVRSIAAFGLREYYSKVEGKPLKAS